MNSRWCVALLLVLPYPGFAAEFASDFRHVNDRVWVGAAYWANPMEDWRVDQGRLECLSGAADRNVHLLTHALADRPGTLTMSVRIDLLDRGRKAGTAGFRIGARDRVPDYRAAALRGHGIDAGVTSDGVLFLGNRRTRTGQPVTSATLHLTATADQGGAYRVTLTLSDRASGARRAEVSLHGVAQAQLVGSLALVSNVPSVVSAGTTRAARFAFHNWTIGGSKVETHPERAFGPILWAMHTLSRRVLTMTAQMPPLGEKDPHDVELEIRRAGVWKTIGRARIDDHAHTATFRVKNWDDQRKTPYRLVYGANRYTGTVRPNPRRRAIVIAAFTGNNDYGFPHADVVRHVRHFRPDLLVFTGDQIYEGVGDYDCPRQPLRRAMLVYLRKWYLFGWEYHRLLRDIPAICLPDDHDVFHGNLWGCGGKAAAPGEGFAAQDSGGYKMPPAFVNMVQRTQTSHHPAPYDPRPVRQGIGVYYGAMNYGGISFAILEDRKFKSAPKPLLPAARIVNGWAQNPAFDSARDGDVPGAELLGKRQLKFLDRWVADWTDHAWMKVVVSQTLFADVATLPRGVHSDKVTPRLKIMPPGSYAPDERPVQDHDSNGWPQTGRNKALRIIRKAFALHIAGDQHLGSTVHYGVDRWNDAGYAICVPSVANIWPRRWYPSQPGRNRRPGAPKNTGEFLDGFGNKVTVCAVANPRAVAIEPKWINQRAPGYGIVTLDPMSRHITLACWPRWVDPARPGAKPYPGWPVTIKQTDNYGRRPAHYLGECHADGVKNAVIQVIDETTGTLVYALRLRGNTIRPWVYADHRYTVKIGDPDTNTWTTFSGQGK